MSRVHQRGRDQWTSRGTPRHYQLPMAKPGATRAQLIFWLLVALATTGAFAASF